MTEEPETLGERFRQAGDSGMGDALSMHDLVGKVFQVVTFTPGESEGKWGTQRWNLAQVIIEDGDETFETEAFLSGARVNRQLDWLLYERMLPARVRVIRRGDLQGNPWDLVPAEAEVPDETVPPEDSALVQAAKKRGASEKARKKADPLQHFRNEDGSVKWQAFVARWQKEGFGLDELGDIIGANSASALEHWLATDKARTITTLKEQAIAKRAKPAEEEPPFE